MPVLLPSWQVQPSLRLRVWPLQPSSREQPFPVYLREGFALPLFLGGGTALGCDVGNSSAAGRPLHFLLAGPKGEGHFLDEGANDFTFKWEAGEVRVTGKKTSPLTWEILSAAE